MSWNENNLYQTSIYKGKDGKLHHDPYLSSVSDIEAEIEEEEREIAVQRKKERLSSKKKPFWKFW